MASVRSRRRDAAFEQLLGFLVYWDLLGSRPAPQRRRQLADAVTSRSSSELMRELDSPVGLTAYVPTGRIRPARRERDLARGVELSDACMRSCAPERCGALRFAYLRARVRQSDGWCSRAGLADRRVGRPDRGRRRSPWPGGLILMLSVWAAWAIGFAVIRERVGRLDAGGERAVGDQGGELAIDLRDRVRRRPCSHRFSQKP